MPSTEKKLVVRSKKVAFYGILGSSTFERMKNFTSINKASNPKEYSRQYVDEDAEETDVVGYAPSISYALDLYTGNKVHEDIVNITDGEKIGDDAVREIVVVDLTSKGTAQDTYNAVKRKYAVIPDAEGDGAEAYTYSGNFKCKSAKEDIVVSISADGLTATVVTQVQESKTK